MPEYIWCIFGSQHSFYKGKSCLRIPWQAFEGADKLMGKGDPVDKGFFAKRVCAWNFFAWFHWTPNMLMGEEVTIASCTKNLWAENIWKLLPVSGMFVLFL